MPAVTPTLRIVIPGGSGQIGRILARHFTNQGHTVTVLSRKVRPAPWHVVAWNGRELGDWASEIDGADVVINLTGRSVNCRYTSANRREIMDSRLFSTQIIGHAIVHATHPPRLWMNASTATIYRHSLDQAMDEANGELGGSEPDVPSAWRFSIDVATRWEQAFFLAPAPNTRKIALRSAMVMSANPGGTFSMLLNLARAGLGGSAASGKQFMSWIHERDFVRAIDFLIAQNHLQGAINVSAPAPLPNRDFMRILRQAAGIPFGLPSARWMLEIGAFFLRTETELILKSRRVVPGRLTNAGFGFCFPDWKSAAQDLVGRWRQGPICDNSREIQESA